MIFYHNVRQIGYLLNFLVLPELFFCTIPLPDLYSKSKTMYITLYNCVIKCPVKIFYHQLQTKKDYLSPNINELKCVTIRNIGLYHHS